MRAPVLLAAIAVTALGGCFLRTGWVLDKLNEGSSTPSNAPPPPVYDPVGRIGKLTALTLEDSYLDPNAAAATIRAVGGKPDALLTLTECLLAHAGGDDSRCYKWFSEKVVHPGFTDWKLAAPPDPTKSDLADAPPPAEVDAERLLGNVLELASALVAFRQAAGQDLAPQIWRDGIARGSGEAAAYVTARHWKRQLKKPTTALVLGGGAANGAFSAGAVHRLLTILEWCKHVPVANGGCGDAHVDFVAGTSTGSLIGTLVDAFHTPGREAEAKKLLVDNYTCTSESDLYCRNSTWIWKLGSSVTGLVRFDGVEHKLRQALSEKEFDNPTELVTVSVDFASSQIYAISDQDPVDLLPLGPEHDIRDRLDGRINGVLASIVEPVLGEPVPWIPSNKGRIEGAFMDGGVRSIVPLMQAVMRGAERVAVFANDGTETGRDPIPQHALAILMRTLDLYSTQSRIGEVQQAELVAVARRMGEYNVCKDRMDVQTTDDKVLKSIAWFCERRGPGFEPEKFINFSSVPTWLGQPHFTQVETSFKAARVFEPEVGLPHASAYAFDPSLMRPLFLGGVRVFQQRCHELRALLNIPGVVASKACDEKVDAVVAATEKEFAPLAQCAAKTVDKRTCE